jgi:hypothetical protein
MGYVLNRKVLIEKSERILIRIESNNLAVNFDFKEFIAEKVILEWIVPSIHRAEGEREIVKTRKEERYKIVTKHGQTTSVLPSDCKILRKHV